VIISVFGTYFNIFEILLLFLLLLFLPGNLLFFGSKIKIKDRNLLNSFLILSILYLAFILISYFGAIEGQKVLKSFFKWLEILVLSIFIFIYIRNQNNFKKIYWILAVSNFVIIFFFIVEVLQTNLNFFNYGALPGYPSVIALGLLLPFLNRKNKVIILSSVVLFLIALFSLVRGVWLTLIIYFIFIFKELPLNKKIKFGALSTIVFVFLLSYTPLGSKVAYRLSERVSNIERLGMANIALKAFSENPLTGVGSLNFPNYLLANTDRSIIFSDEPEKLEPHNVFLQVAAEEGVFALIVFLGMILILYYIVFKYNRLDPSNFLGNYAKGLKYLSIPVLIIILFGYISDFYRFLFIIFIGLTLSLFRLTSNDINEKSIYK